MVKYITSQGYEYDIFDDGTFQRMNCPSGEFHIGNISEDLQITKQYLESYHDDPLKASVV